MTTTTYAGAGVGLTSAEAAARLRAHGPNLVPAPPPRGVLRRAARQLVDPMLLLLWAAGALTTWRGDLADTAVIVLVMVVNTSVGVVQELRAERAVSALRAMAAPRTRAVRDGTLTELAAADLVPGDLVLLDAGDVVPADGTVDEAHQVTVDEAAVTGESVAVPKLRDEAVLAGTTVTGGRATAVVTGTGPDSTLGRIAAMVATARPGPTPLQRRLTRLGSQLAVAAVVAGGTVVALSLARGLGWEAAALQGASLAVAAVPESLPAVVTLALALGARRMARHHAIARELRAVETLGSVTVLATDKTGTLTENRLVVTSAWTPAGEHRVTGAGYAPTGEVLAAADAWDELHLLGRDAVLCNDADLEERDGAWFPLGDPTEAALVAFAARSGLDVAAVRAAHPRTAEVPFDSERGWMLTSHRDPAGSPVHVVKGAPEQVLRRVGTDTAAMRAWCRRQAEQGSRVLAVAEAGHHDGSGLPLDLRLVGALAMSDPPRAGVAAVVDRLRTAGVRLAVMTGDQPATAAAVARSVGLDGEVVDASVGHEVTSEVAVYARVRPEDKLALVRGWQAAHEVVAVTGDGVNDGPALRQADIGVAMGRGGTEVARQAADLVLTDDDLATVVHAVEEGRRVHDNLRRFLAYALGGGLAEVLYVVAAPLLGFRVPLLPGQILWINMLTHGLPGVAMGAEPAAADVLARPPLDPAARVLDRPVLRRVLTAGVLIAVVTTTAAVLARRDGDDWQTAAFLVLGLAQLGVALAVRDAGAARRGVFLTGATALAAALQVGAVLLPPLRDLLHLSSVSGSTWLMAVGLSLVPAAVLRSVRPARGRPPPRAGRPGPAGGRRARPGCAPASSRPGRTSPRSPAR